MKWIGVVGSRKNVSDTVEQDVRRVVHRILANGNGIVSGGASGVDFIAVNEALKNPNSLQRIKVIIPTNIKTYRRYFNRQVVGGYISRPEVTRLFSQLAKLNEMGCLTELTHTFAKKSSFHARNAKIIAAADEIEAFQIGDSTGTQNTIRTAESMGKSVNIRHYEVI